MESKKLSRAVGNLKAALDQYSTQSSELNFLTVAKAFETALEYAWRELKRQVDDLGLEALAPKVAVKEAAKLHLISNPELWLECIDARNDSVHDYFGISNAEYADLAREFLKLIKSAKAFT